MKKLIIIFLFIATNLFSQGLVTHPPALDPADFTGKYIYSNGTAFVPVTRSEILGYKSYVALLSQSDTNAPVATVLQNEIGEIIWSRSSTGIFTAISNGLFTENKTHLSVSLDIVLVYESERFSFLNWQTTSILDLNINSGNLTTVDGIGRAYVEIRVYN